MASAFEAASPRLPAPPRADATRRRARARSPARFLSLATRAAAGEAADPAPLLGALAARVAEAVEGNGSKGVGESDAEGWGGEGNGSKGVGSEGAGGVGRLSIHLYSFGGLERTAAWAAAQRGE